MEQTYENKHIKVIVESIASGKLCIGMGVDNKNEQEENSFTLLFRAKRQLLSCKVVTFFEHKLHGACPPSYSSKQAPLFVAFRIGNVGNLFHY